MTDPSGGSVPERRPQPQQPQSQSRKQVLLRLDPLVHEALARWAADELRSANAQIEYLLRRALAEAGRLPGGAGPIPRRGRPSATDADADG
ncbi:toxin-antitoxin system HicB family antitoxin [Streptomyces mirabilis]|uniref:toxin-antitoxin system HicB family antitoxin n=1 Tax=Streptomyces mirabilis TaxID=68239 RepID=UPI0033A25EEB